MKGEIYMKQSKMTDQEFLNSFINDRVDMVLANLKRNKSPEEEKKILEAEQFIQTLTEEKRKLIENLIDDAMILLSLEEPFLYRQGFIDGIKVAKTFMKL